jgi:hypothetical protein
MITPSFASFGAGYNSKTVTVLDSEALRSKAPSIFAETPMSGVSDRYRFVSTASVIDTLQGEGWEPVRVDEQSVRLETRIGFQMHMVRFARRDDVLGATARKVGDVRTELILKNSHDRSSAFQIEAGLFRLACLNGLVVSDSVFERVSIPHVRVAPEAFVEAAAHICQRTPVAMEAVQRWQAKPLSAAARREFASKAATLRWNGPDVSVTPSAETLLVERRSSDRGFDLWTTFNVVQENLVRGGARYYHPQSHKRGRVRAIKGIAENVRLNKELWQLAEDFSRN